VLLGVPLRVASNVNPYVISQEKETIMDLATSVAVVTGANRGLGRHLAAQLVERGAKVYAAARRPESVDLPGVTPLRLDLTDPATIEQAAKAAPDVTLLVNNAGVFTGASLVGGDLDAVRLEMETHYFGTLRAVRAFSPQIAANGGGAILNVLSVLSWLHPAGTGAYSAAKAAGWAMSNALREELAPSGIGVTALHVGYMDTDMAAHVDAAKSDPAVVAAAALDGLTAGVPEVLADDLARHVKAGLSGIPAAG
jgi:NAD(P)-dependent dehydrogenase (short-subunit alcohol dehydrogenase family)